MAYDSRPDTHEHIAQVRGLVLGAAANLTERAHRHDRSKLEPPEVEVFDRVTPLLKESTYGSDEYKGFLADMGEGLRHHYAENDHHPEHFPEGVDHETTCHDRTDYLPGGEITVCDAWCAACDWTETGDPADTRDAAAGHERDAHVLS